MTIDEANAEIERLRNEVRGYRMYARRSVSLYVPIDVVAWDVETEEIVMGKAAEAGGGNDAQVR